MRLLGFRTDDSNNSMQLFVHRGRHFLRYLGEDIELKIEYRMVVDGTYEDNVRDIPYFVLNNRVYPIKSFQSLYKDKNRK